MKEIKPWKILSFSVHSPRLIWKFFFYIMETGWPHYCLGFVVLQGEASISLSWKYVTAAIDGFCRSLLVMKGKSACLARHAMCPSPDRRVAITFFRIRPDSNQDQIKSLTSDMARWQPGIRSPFATSNAGLYGYEAADMIPPLGILRAPVVMLAPIHPMLLSPNKIQPGGTGVFLPWPTKSRKPARYLPPRARKGRLPDLPSPVETHGADCTTLLGDTVTQTGVSWKWPSLGATIKGLFNYSQH